MTRFLILAALLGVVGCNKPSKEDCRKAIGNMQHLLGTEHLKTDIEGEVRRCNGSSSREAVDCAIKATTLEDLRHCKFMKVPDSTGSAAAPGSAPGSGSGSAQ